MVIDSIHNKDHFHFKTLILWITEQFVNIYVALIHVANVNNIYLTII